MPQKLLNQILDQMQTLEPSELQQLSHALQTYLVDQETSTNRVAFHQALVEAGLVQQIKTPAFERKTHLVQVQCEPLSQTIIEERR
jgi:hypothetical protein